MEVWTTERLVICQECLSCLGIESIADEHVTYWHIDNDCSYADTTWSRKVEKITLFPNNDTEGNDGEG